MPRAYIETILVEAGKTPLIALDQLRIERSLPIARDANADLGGLRPHRLLRIAVAAFARPSEASLSRWSSNSASRTRSAGAFFNSSK